MFTQRNLFYFRWSKKHVGFYYSLCGVCMLSFCLLWNPLQLIAPTYSGHVKLLTLSSFSCSWSLWSGLETQVSHAGKTQPNPCPTCNLNLNSTYINIFYLLYSTMFHHALFKFQIPILLFKLQIYLVRTRLTDWPSLFCCLIGTVSCHSDQENVLQLFHNQLCIVFFCHCHTVMWIPCVIEVNRFKRFLPQWLAHTHNIIFALMRHWIAAISPTQFFTNCPHSQQIFNIFNQRHIWHIVHVLFLLNLSPLHCVIKYNNRF